MSLQKPLFAFFGTPRFSVNVLDALEAHGMLPALVITAPDRPQGRGLALAPSPVKKWAQERGIDVLTPERLKDEAFLAELANTEWDVFVVAAYAKLIPKALLDMPRRGCVNVHPSLLPKLRGPSPALSAVLLNERTSGVSIMQMSEKMDEGPVIAQGRVELDEESWPPLGSLYEDLLATEGGNLLAETLPLWIAGSVEAQEQEHAEATYTKKFTDADSLVDLAGDPMLELCKIRAFDKSPRAHLYAHKGDAQIRVIITEAHIENGALVIDRVLPEGKKEMLYADFQRGL